MNSAQDSINAATKLKYDYEIDRNSLSQEQQNKLPTILRPAIKETRDLTLASILGEVTSAEKDRIETIARLEQNIANSSSSFKEKQTSIAGKYSDLGKKLDVIDRVNKNFLNLELIADLPLRSTIPGLGDCVAGANKFIDENAQIQMDKAAPVAAPIVIKVKAPVSKDGFSVDHLKELPKVIEALNSFPVVEGDKNAQRSQKSAARAVAVIRAGVVEINRLQSLNEALKKNKQSCDQFDKYITKVKKEFMNIAAGIGGTMIESQNRVKYNELTEPSKVNSAALSSNEVEAAIKQELQKAQVDESKIIIASALPPKATDMDVNPNSRISPSSTPGATNTTGLNNTLG